MSQNSTKKFSVGMVAGGILTAAVVAAAWTAMGGAKADAPAAAPAPSTVGAPQTGELPAGHPPLNAGTPAVGNGAGNTAPAAAAGPKVEGTVLEALQVPNYTYLKLKTEGGEVWAAVPTTDVKVGDTVGVAGAFPMKGFESKTLGRTFEEIYFGTLAAK